MSVIGLLALILWPSVRPERRCFGYGFEDMDSNDARRKLICTASMIIPRRLLKAICLLFSVNLFTTSYVVFYPIVHSTHGLHFFETICTNHTLSFLRGPTTLHSLCFISTLRLPALQIAIQLLQCLFLRLVNSLEFVQSGVRFVHLCF